MKLIETVEGIIQEYAAQDYDLTLRQIYYQCVARDIIANKQTEYKRLGSIVNDARLAGLVDWDSIVDRTRKHEENSHWLRPSDILYSAAQSYAIDTRSDQDYYVEVWVEKDALVGIIEKACQPLDIGYLSSRGYVSQSAMWRAAQRFMVQEPQKESILIHLGDHDPSGIDMTRDIQDRLEMFGSTVDVIRIALNMDQIKQYSPPSNPAKTTDSRYKSYIIEHGEESWELDALDPRTLVELITKHASDYTDDSRRASRIRTQEEGRRQIQQVAEDCE